jgi:hypothetical protein
VIARLAVRIADLRSPAIHPTAHADEVACTYNNKPERREAINSIDALIELLPLDGHGVSCFLTEAAGRCVMRISMLPVFNSL